MDRVKENITNVEQELRTIKENILPIPMWNMKNNNEIFHQKHSIRDVLGIIKLASSPHYCLVLETGPADQPFTLPIVMVDSSKHIDQWILVVGKKVWIDQMVVVFERFQNFDDCQELECTNAVLLLEDITILEDSTVRVDSGSALTDMLKESLLNVDNDSNNSCRITVHHVSSALYIDQPPAVCLVLVSYTNKNLVETKLWLVLTAEQVSWKEFLIPNREYLISFPQPSNRFRFDGNKKPLKELFPSRNKELEVLFHHQNLFPTLNGCYLPRGSNIFLTCNTQFSDYVYQFVRNTSCLWFSSDEADFADTSLVSIYGQIDVINYDYEAIFKSCYLCIRAKARSPPLAKPELNTTYSWTNPWISKSSLDKDDLLALPTAEGDCGVMNLGVPGKLVQIIKLRDVITGKELSVFVKHSFILKCQQMCRLFSGMVICITHLNRRLSTKGKYYYIATLLSSIKILSIPSDLCQNGCWGEYGLNCSATTGGQDRIWGVLETINLTKVAINTKCTNCNSIFSRGICSEECSFPAAQTSAYAIGWLQVIQDKNTISLEKVIVKDSLVRELLSIPEDIWQCLLKASIEEEMVCFFSNQDWIQSTTSLNLCELFKMYCFIPKPNGKFYVSVKKVASSPDNEPIYYCIHLKPVEESRLKIIGELAKKSLK